MRKPSVLLLVAMLMFTSCSSDDETTTAPEPPSEVTGVILEVDSEGVDDVRSFRLKEGDQTYEIFIASDVDYGFPLGHLSEHLTSGDPVKVPLEERDGKLYALSIEDV